MSRQEISDFAIFEFANQRLIILNHQSVVPMPPGCYVSQKEYKRNGQETEHGHIERHITKTERKETLSMSYEKSCQGAAGEKFLR